MKGRKVRKSTGNMMDFVTIGISVLAMAIVVLAAFHSMNLMLRKLEVSQIARKYILVMETEGCLTGENHLRMMEELKTLGLKEIDLTGTTMQPVNYGEAIILKIRAKIAGAWINADQIWSEGFGKREFYVEETRMSTAKN